MVHGPGRCVDCCVLLFDVRLIGGEARDWEAERKGQGARAGAGDAGGPWAGHLLRAERERTLPSSMRNAKRGFRPMKIDLVCTLT